jgi:3-hydroxyacyl-CoA dehydrogenase/enoyl-CoA hydratase/3-hydroxybutyryl-CoA epimerase
MDNMKYEVDSDGVALITWDMPDRSMNVLNRGSQDDLEACIDKALADEAVKGIVLTSGKNAFVAGADLDSMSSSSAKAGSAPRSKEETAARLMKSSDGMNKLLRKIELGGKPVVAAINGTALGGGLEVCLACHHRIAAANPRAKIGLPEAKIGLLPGGGGTQRLPRLIGAAKALPLILNSTHLNPKQALAAGIVEKVVASEQLIAEAKAIINSGEARSEQPWDRPKFKVPGGKPTDRGSGNVYLAGTTVLRKATYGNYPAQMYIQRCVFEGLMVPFDAGMRIEARYFAKIMMDPASRNMMRSLFHSPQQLSKGARRPQNIGKTECRTVGILGAGMMGAGIAYVSARAGIEVVLLDCSLENAGKGKSYSDKLLNKAISRGKSTEEKKATLLDKINTTTDFADLKDCDMVIEAVFEDRAVKAEVTEKTEAVISSDCIFASNTSTLPISGLAQASARPEQFIGLHFFSPVDKMDLVEIIMGEQTGEKALAVAMDYVARIRKTPIVVNDSRGFYTSRCFGTYLSEGVRMLSEGIKPALIENAGKMTGMPVAPLAINDDVSLQLTYTIAKTTEKDLGADFKRTADNQLIKDMVEVHGRLGRKVGKGFYDYPEGGRKHLWSGLSELVTTATEQPDVEEVKKRLLYIQALATAQCFEENVVTDVRDADVGAILGWGFAPYTGGPLSLIDTIGTAQFVAECRQMAQRYGSRFEPCELLREMAENNEKFYVRFNPKKSAA